MDFCSVEEAVEEIRQGRMLILLDDEDRENEGDFILAAELCTAEDINFISKFGRGLICTPLSPERAEALALDPIVQRNTALHGTNFTVTVDYKYNTTTGISAHDRALTCRALADPKTRPEDLARPGHISPLQAVPGGVLRRAGHTEAVVDLVRMAGLNPVGILCEILNEDGTMARVPELFEMAREHGLKVFSIEQLIKHRRRTEKLVYKAASTRLPTQYGDFVAHAYHTNEDNKTYLAMVMGDVNTDDPVLVRVHSKCLTGDVFHSMKCDCGPQLELALQKIGEAGRGVLLYLEQEGRGIGLAAKIQAYELQDHGFDTVEANQKLGFPPDLRDYGLGCQVLLDLGLKKVRLMTNNRAKLVGIEGYGLEVVERVPLKVDPNESNLRYLETKRDKMGHLLDHLHENPSGNGKNGAAHPTQAADSGQEVEG
ncbi:MAG: bifunctional 3,4-dihydroxy-2-butanone-4-phosphate synthase/GTP cyclohydrolase II [Armatimonadetes bacterium]|nr:bifunctional 3,4-dihydroxy-2-butanone-4-phosphate synthase/GTP cyclohydrolase II [Armatimonadota bacterium]